MTIAISDTAAYLATLAETAAYPAVGADTLGSDVVGLYRSIILGDRPSGYWRLDDAAGQTGIADSSGNGCNGVTSSNNATPGAVTGPYYPYSGLVLGAAFVGRSNPLLYWRLDDTTTAAADASGNNNGGTYSGAYTQSQPGALTQDSDTATAFSGGAVTSTSSTIFQMGTGSFSYGCWLKTSANPGVAQVVLWKGGASAASAGFDLEINSSNVLVANIADGTNQARTNTGVVINDGLWHFVVVVVDRSAQKLNIYVDGVLKGTSASTSTVGSITNTGAAFTIGNAIGTPFTGTLDEVCVWNYALTLDLVSALYQSGRHTAPADFVTLQQPGAITDGDPATVFDGNLGLINVGAPAPLLTATLSAMTIEAWINFTGDGWAFTDYIAGKYGNFGNGGYFLAISRGTGKVQLGVRYYSGTVDNSAATTIAGCPVLSDGHWHHVVGVWDGTNLLSYADGVQVGSGTFAFPNLGPDGNVFQIGHLSGFSGNFRGSIDDVAFYRYALSAAQIRNHYLAGLAAIGATASCKDTAA